jgi:Tetracyclin repressor-like, C-terminal domain
MAMIGFDEMRSALEASAPPETTSTREEFLVIARAYVNFGATNPELYRLMFAAEEYEETHVSERALGAFGVLVGLLERGQASGALRRRPIQGQAAACWAQVHGMTMLTIDGLLLPEKVGADAVDSALITLLEGLESNGR